MTGPKRTGSQNLILIRKTPGKILCMHLKLDILTQKKIGRRSDKYSNRSKNQIKTLGNTLLMFKKWHQKSLSQKKQTIQALLKGINPKLRPDIQKANPENIKDFITVATQAQSINADSEETQTPAVETFISAIQPYFEKQMNALSETLEKKIALSIASVSKPHYNRNPSNQPRMEHHSYNTQFQPRHQQFHIRPTLPNPNQRFNNTRTFQINSWQQTRHSAPANSRQYRPTNPYGSATVLPTHTYRPCRGCSSSDHRRGDCSYKETICNFCGYKGHIDFACEKKRNSQ